MRAGHLVFPDRRGGRPRLAGVSAAVLAAGLLTAAVADAATDPAGSRAVAPAALAAACGATTGNAEVVLSGSAWTARHGSQSVYTGSDMRSAVQAAVNSLTAGRTS